MSLIEKGNSTMSHKDMKIQNRNENKAAKLLSERNL
jgi:hypothetical protein